MPTRISLTVSPPGSVVYGAFDHRTFPSGDSPLVYGVHDYTLCVRAPTTKGPVNVGRASRRHLHSRGGHAGCITECSCVPQRHHVDHAPHTTGSRDDSDDPDDAQDTADERARLIVEFNVPADAFMLATTLAEVPETIVEFEQFIPTRAAPLPYLWATDEDRYPTRPHLHRDRAQRRISNHVADSIRAETAHRRTRTPCRGVPRPVRDREGPYDGAPAVLRTETSTGALVRRDRPEPPGADGRGGTSIGVRAVPPSGPVPRRREPAASDSRGYRCTCLGACRWPMCLSIWIMR